VIESAQFEEGAGGGDGEALHLHLAIVEVIGGPVVEVVVVVLLELLVELGDEAVIAAAAAGQIQGRSVFAVEGKVLLEDHEVEPFAVISRKRWYSSSVPRVDTI
jgi:hypothetical protein